MTMAPRRRSTRANRRPPIRNIKESSPLGVDHTMEYAYIRRDLIRILLLGGGLVALMIIVAVLGIF